MLLVCPECNANYNIPKEKLPTRNAALVCKGCRHRIPVIVKDSAANKAAVVSETATEPPFDAAPVETTSVLPHPLEILETYSEAERYEPAKYNLAEILVRNKKGRYKTALNTQKLKLMLTVKPVLDGLLGPGEQVLRMAGGTAYYPSEMLFGNGSLTMLYNRYILAATNKRLLAINTDARMKKPTHYLFQFPYANLKKVTKGIFGTSLTLMLKRGKKRIFNGIKRGFGSELTDWLKSQVTPQHPLTTETDAYSNLCPACYVPSAQNLETCGSCGAGFKSPRKAALRSLVLPGWGDMYLGHRFLGGIELLGALFIWLIALLMMFDGTGDGFVVGGLMLVFYNGMDALLTRHMASKGYALEKK